eukprot:TRINITY_DN91372_c0_g1_i1.p1 TRINITY_DN91372_c0_g1~~TRINITY_DN91372_c0_g1_i1.p1  ORF type:complete len:312 (-),score=61.93 TRINITY_DN91372_c0_g1_i1:271-1161(-)
MVPPVAARGGCSGGREAAELCPHSSEAIPYTTALQCWQARVTKELARLAPPQKSASSPDLSTVSAPKMPPREYFPIGSRNPLNNASDRFKDVVQPPLTKTPASLYQTLTGFVPHEKRLDSLADLAKAEAARGAAAQQLSALRQRGQGTLLRLGKMQAEELNAARMEGQHTMVALAEGMSGAPRSRSQARPSTEPHSRSRINVQNGSLFTAARAEGRKGAAANQLSAVRQRSEGTILRLGRFSEEQLAAASAEGQGTMVEIASAAKAAMHPALRQQKRRPPATDCGRATLISLPGST